MRFQTTAIHAGVDKDSAFNSVITPIYQTSTFRFEDIGKTKGFDYSRTANPTRKALEENIAALERGAGAVATATGMAAITTVLHLLKSGDHVVCTHDCYGGTERLLRTFAELHGIQVSYVNMRDLDAVRRALTPATRMVWVETPSNPLLNVVDISALTAIARSHNAWTVVDNTFLSPAQQRPFEFGADLIVHSTTKYLNGHSDVVGGAVVSRTKELAERIQWLCNALGQCASPFDCWLVLRGIKTLSVRVRQHEANALRVATFLESHPSVSRVFYPGLPSHPDHELARRQQSGFGGVVSFELDGTKKDVDRLLSGVKIFALAESLGGIESLIDHPVTMTHASMKPELRDAAGINDRIIRLSVGIEDAEDLIEDLARALPAQTSGSLTEAKAYAHAG